MNKTQMNQFNMMKSVDKFFTNHQSLVSTNPAIVATVNKLKSLISDINSLSNVQAVNTKADSAIKAEVKKRLINTALKVAGGLSAQAAAMGDARLKQAADITLSELNVMREADLLIKIRTIHEAALPITAELAVWGVVQSDIDDLITIADEYSTQSPAIRNLVAKTEQATTDLKARMKEANTLLKDTLDAMMLPFKTLQPSLYGEYLNARAIVDLGGGRTTAPVDTKPAE